MLKGICTTVNRILGAFDFTVQRKSDLLAERWEREALKKLYVSSLNRAARGGRETAACIVFSKDRALQLHALLVSYFEQVSGPVPARVLYWTSSDAHRQAYEEVQALFAGQPVSFVCQQGPDSFHSDLIRLLESLQEEKVFFLVDDIVFTESLDMGAFIRFDPFRFVPTLRMGLNLKHSYTMQQQQSLPEFNAGVIDDEDKVCWQWQQGEMDWAYPLSVDGHLFSVQELTAMAKLIHFQAPNSFEANLQKFSGLFTPRYGVCYRKSRIINIPCNKVQSENENLCGNVHQDDLLERWREGLQLDYHRLYGFVNESAHQEVEMNFVARSGG